MSPVWQTISALACIQSVLRGMYSLYYGPIANAVPLVMLYRVQTTAGASTHLYRVQSNGGAFTHRILGTRVVSTHYVKSTE